MYKFLAAFLLLMMLILTAQGRAEFFERRWTSSQFAEFAAALAERPPREQKKFILESLVEYYDQDCRRDEQRVVKREAVVSKWKNVLPGREERERENLSFRVREDTKNNWAVVALSKNETWLYGELYFARDEWARSWRLAGFKFELEDPGSCME